MVLAEPLWLRTAGDIAGTVLVIEMGLVLLILCALTLGLAYAMWWVRRHLVPVLASSTAQVQGALETARQGGERIVAGVAEFRGRQVMLKTMLRSFLLGDYAKRAPRPAATAPTMPRGEAPPPGGSDITGSAPGMLPVEQMPTATSTLPPIPRATPLGQADTPPEPARHGAE